MKAAAAIPGYDPKATAPNGYTFDQDAADDVVCFFETALSHIEGEVAGQPFMLEPWQRFMLFTMFGWKRPDGSRRYREAFIYVPRKNGKTPLCAGIALYMSGFDGEAGAQTYSAAADREQAALVYRHAAGMVNQNSHLRGQFKPYRTFKSLEHAATGSIFKALSSDANTKHGLNAHCVIVDELHAHRDGELLHTLETSTASRAQPLLISITTADYARESICNTKYEYACKVRDGVISDPSFLPVIYEASVDDDWTDPKVWAKANPNLDVSVRREYLERECLRAAEEPSYLNTFLRLHLNVRTNADVAWFDMNGWDGCAGEHEYAQLAEVLKGERCFAGFDLAKTTDLTAFSLYFPERFALLTWFWIPRVTAVKAEKRDRVPYLTWAREGFLEMTEGNVTDYDHVAMRVKQISADYSPELIAYDPWNATQMATGLQADGLEMLEHRQGYKSMSEPSKELERLVVSGDLIHGGHPVLRWCASNVMVETDPAGNIKPSKRKSTGRIDGIVSGVMAVGLSTVDAGPVTSIYEGRGVITL